MICPRHIGAAKRNGVGRMLDVLNMGKNHLVEVPPSSTATLAFASIDQRVIPNERDEIYLLPQLSECAGRVDL